MVKMYNATWGKEKKEEHYDQSEDEEDMDINENDKEEEKRQNICQDVIHVCLTL